MIINPSAHTMIPRRNVYRRQATFRGKRNLVLPGGRQLWIGSVKLLLSVLCVCFAVTAFLNNSAVRLSTEIDALTTSEAELHTANILLSSQKAKLFSPDSIGSLAKDQLAIHLPASGQHRFFRKSTGMFY